MLTRTTRALSLTHVAARDVEDARRPVRGLAIAEGQLPRGEQQISGWLRVAASVGFATRA